MSNKTRVYGCRVGLECTDVRDFFDKQAIKHEGSLAAVTMQTQDIAEMRDVSEYEKVFNKFSINNSSKVIDLGCGIGRWARWFLGKVKNYDGIDFSNECIKVAKEKFEQVGFCFYYWDLRELSDFKSFNTDGYDLFIINGTFMYLNDKEVENVLAFLSTIMSNGSQIYLRESISVIDSRLTLKNFYSDELETSYNAIYRTDDEYLKLFNRFLNSVGFRLRESALLLNDVLNHREETNQKYYLFDRA